jgi:hypothetical protein
MRYKSVKRKGENFCTDYVSKYLLMSCIFSHLNRFFSFAAPTKKKSSGTNPVIFPVAQQSATAGVGEVVKATDEVMLITTGAKPTDYLTASTAESLHDTESLSKFPDTPYRLTMRIKYLYFIFSLQMKNGNLCTFHNILWSYRFCFVPN